VGGLVLQMIQGVPGADTLLYWMTRWRRQAADLDVR